MRIKGTVDHIENNGKTMVIRGTCENYVANTWTAEEFKTFKAGSKVSFSPKLPRLREWAPRC